MNQNFWQSDPFQDAIFLGQVEDINPTESNIFDTVYREVGKILLKHINLCQITCPNILNYITLKFDNEQPVDLIYQPNYILVEQLAAHPEVKQIAEQLQIEDLINHNQCDAEYFQDYYQNIIENFKSHISQTQEIFLKQIQLLLEKVSNQEVNKELQLYFSKNLFRFPQSMEIESQEMQQQDKIRSQLFVQLKQLQSLFINQTSAQKEKQEKHKTKNIQKIENIEKIDNSDDNYDYSKRISHFIVNQLSKEQIKQIINWLIDEKIPIPEIILCAELKNRGNGINLTFNPNQQILDIATNYQSLYQNSISNQMNKKKIEEEEENIGNQENQQKKSNKIIDCNLIIGMMELIIQQKDVLKDKIINRIKYSQLQHLLTKMYKVTETDAHYKNVQHFIEMLKEIENIFLQEQKMIDQKQKTQLQNDDLSDNENEIKQIKCSKKYQRLLKQALKLILIQCVELEIPVPQLMISLWFKKHKEKIVQGQIINQNSIQILPSKQKLIQYLQQDARLHKIIHEVQLEKLILLPDSKVSELDDFEEFLSKFPVNQNYSRDVILIEQLLKISVQKKEAILKQLVQVILESARLDKIIVQLKKYLEVLPKLRTNKTQINDEPVVQNIINMIELLKDYVNETMSTQPNQLKGIHVQHQHQLQQLERLDKEGLKLYILSALITLIENQVVVPEIFLYLGIKNKTKKFSLQINKNYKLQEYLTRKMHENGITIEEQIENKLLLKKVKISEQEYKIRQRQQISEPQLIIRALKQIVQLDYNQQLADSWSKQTVCSIKNQVYKYSSKNNRADTTMGQIKSLFSQLDQKHEQFIHI